ncbi:MAG: (Fe-S)-binding protein, partial [Promethearchaeota archaeon]
MSEKKRGYPTKEVDPDNFLTNEEVLWLLENQDSYKFKQEDYKKIYNCVHCRECGTSDERILLKQKFLKDGNKIEGLDETIEIFEKFGTPYKKNKSRIKLPEGISKSSDTLLYFGCFPSVKAPKYAEHAALYLIRHNVDFSVLNEEICCGYPILVNGAIETYNRLVERNKNIFKNKNFKKIITICPSCYMVFKKHYSNLGIKIEYITAYLKPSETKKSGSVSIQHPCPLVYDEIPKIDKYVENLLKTSGYNVIDIPLWCCGGGIGHQLRKDVSEKIAKIRVKDYKGDYVTYYCPDCYWFIKVFGRKAGIKPKLKDLFELLI